MGVVCKTAERPGSSYSGAETRLYTPEPGLSDDSRKETHGRKADECKQSSV